MALPVTLVTLGGVPVQLVDQTGSVFPTTGTGSLVFNTTPTLVTPILGAATGTSLALGGATIGSNALAVTGTSAFGGTLTVPDGSAATNSIGRVGQPGTGFTVGNNAVALATGGTNRLVVDTGTFQVIGLAAQAPSLAIGGATIGSNALAVTGTAFVSGNVAVAGSTFDPFGRGYANMLSVGSINSGTSAIEINAGAAFNAFLDLGVNGVRVATLVGNATNASFVTAATGTSIIIGVNSQNDLTIANGGIAAIRGTLAIGGATIGANALAVTGNVEIGAGNSITALGSGYFRSISGYVQAPNIIPDASGAITFGGGGSRSSIRSPSDGVIALFNNALGDFSRLQFGGTTSSFPAIKRNATALNFRLADDSADAPITAYSLVLSSTGTGISTLAGPLGLLATGGNLYFGGGGQSLLVSIGSGLGDGLIGYRAAAIVGFSSTALSYNAPDVAIARNGAGILEINNGTAGSFAGLKAAAATFSGAVTVPGVTTAALTSTGTFTSGAAAQVGTLTNAPAAGNPTTWIKIIDNGVTRYIPAW